MDFHAKVRIFPAGGRPLPLHHRQKVFPNGTFIIFSVTTDDAGQYSCLAKGSDNNASASLFMTVKGRSNYVVRPAVAARSRR